MTNLRSALDRYLTMRKGLGYKYEHQTRRLTHFVVFRYLLTSTLPASVPSLWVRTKSFTAPASFGLPFRKAQAMSPGGLAMSEHLWRVGKTCV